MTSVDLGPSARKGGSAPTFTPSHLHRAFGMFRAWAPALEEARRPDGRRLPGSARRVLEILLGVSALHKGPASQLGIVRLSQGSMPRSSVQDGLKALEECGFVTKGKKGWSLCLRPSTPSSPCRKSAPVKGEPCSPGNPFRDPQPPEGPVVPEKAQSASGRNLIAEALIQAGLKPRGAWATARKVKALPEAFPQLLAEAIQIADATPALKSREGFLAHLVLLPTRRLAARLERLRRQGRGKSGSKATPHSLAELQACWQALVVSIPKADAPGYLDHIALSQAAKWNLASHIQVSLGNEAEDLASTLEAELVAAGLQKGSPIWDRAWDHHWMNAMLQAAGITG